MPKRLCLVLTACWSTPTTTAPTTKPPTRPPPSLAAIAGEWAGMGYQPDVDARMEVHMTLAPTAAVGARVGTIAYPSLGCGGELIRIASPPSELRAKEHLTTNRDDGCIDGGTVIVPVTPTDDTLAWKWLFPSGAIGVTATLAKVTAGT